MHRQQSNRYASAKEAVEEAVEEAVSRYAPLSIQPT